MITYEGFIADLRPLLNEIATLCDAKATHEDPTFRRWRNDLQSLLRQIKQAGYELPCVVHSADRYFGGISNFGQPTGFRAYQRDLDDTANELRVVIDAYQRYGEPLRIGAMRSPLNAELKAPQIVTLAWLWDHVPAKLWVVALSALVAAFSLGYFAATMSFVSKFVALFTAR